MVGKHHVRIQVDDSLGLEVSLDLRVEAAAFADVESFDDIPAISRVKEFEQVLTVDEVGLSLGGVLWIDVGIEVVRLVARAHVAAGAVKVFEILVAFC